MCENVYDEIIEHLFIGSAASLKNSDYFDLIVNCISDIFIKDTSK